MSRRKDKKRVSPNKLFPQQENVRIERKKFVCRMVVAPATFGNITLNNGTYLLACKYSKEALREAIENDCFEQNEIDEIGKQLEEKKQLLMAELRRRKIRFAQYVANIKNRIVQQPNGESR